MTGEEPFEARCVGEKARRGLRRFKKKKNTSVFYYICTSFSEPKDLQVLLVFVGGSGAFQPNRRRLFETMSMNIGSFRV